MGLFYRTMIKEIKEAYVLSGFENLEEFLKANEERFKEEYNLGDVLFYMNIKELLQEEKVDSSYFKQKSSENAFWFID